MIRFEEGNFEDLLSIQSKPEIRITKQCALTKAGREALNDTKFVDLAIDRANGVLRLTPVTEKGPRTLKVGSSGSIAQIYPFCAEHGYKLKVYPIEMHGNVGYVQLEQEEEPTEDVPTEDYDFMMRDQQE